MKFDALRHAMIHCMTEELPTLKHIDEHPECWNIETLQQITTQLPAMRIALTGVPKLERIETGEHQAQLDLSIFIACQMPQDLLSDSEILSLIEHVLLVISEQHWQIPDVSPATQIKSQHVSNHAIDEQQVTVWSITWKQSIRVGNLSSQNNHILPDSLYACHDPLSFGEELAYKPLP